MTKREENECGICYTPISESQKTGWVCMTCHIDEIYIHIKRYNRVLRDNYALRRNPEIMDLMGDVNKDEVEFINHNESPPYALILTTSNFTELSLNREIRENLSASKILDRFFPYNNQKEYFYYISLDITDNEYYFVAEREIKEMIKSDYNL